MTTELLERRNQAWERVHRRDPVHWLVNFLNLDLTQIGGGAWRDLGDEINEFALSMSDAMWERPLQKATVRRLQKDVASGIRGLTQRGRVGWDLGRMTVRVKVASRWAMNPQTAEKEVADEVRWRALDSIYHPLTRVIEALERDLRSRFLLAAARAIESSGQGPVRRETRRTPENPRGQVVSVQGTGRIRVCPICERIFVGVKRQEYDSPRCSQQARTRRYLGRHGKEELSEKRHLRYKRRLGKTLGRRVRVARRKRTR